MNTYLVLDIAVHDLESFSAYIQEIPKLIEKHMGRYVVQGEVPEVIEGDWKPERMVIIEFPSKEKAKSFLSDPEAKLLFEIRHKTASSKLLLVEGCI